MGFFSDMMQDHCDEINKEITEKLKYKRLCNLLADTLFKCQQQFEYYEKCHLEKKPADDEKAKINRTYAKMCSEVLKTKEELCK